MYWFIWRYFTAMSCTFLLTFVNEKSNNKASKKHQNGVIDELKKRKRKKRKEKERNIDSGFIRVNGGEKSLIGPHNKKEQKNLSFLIWLS
jgi:hypothetical protein